MKALDRETPIAIIGAGRLGTSLASALVESGYRLSLVSSHDRASAEALAATLSGSVAVASPSESVATAEVVFLTVPDSAIEPVADALAWREGQHVVHCSGAHGLEVFASATARGAIAGCFHPLQTFPSRQPEPARFRGITIGIEAAAPLDAYLESIAGSLGAVTVRLEGVDRAHYHAAAVFASNDLVALIAAAAQTWESAGLPAHSARAALSPLMRAAARNISASPLHEALTGPIARGDISTVARHLDALASNPELRELYRLLARQLLALPLSHSPEIAAQLRDLLY